MNMKTQKDVHNPLFRESPICPKCHEKAIAPEVVEKVKKNYSLTRSGKTFLIRLTGLILLALNCLIVEMVLSRGWIWSFTAWFVQLAIGCMLTAAADYLADFEPLVKVTEK